MEQKDNSIVKISTLHYKKYSIKKYPMSLIVEGHEYEAKDFYETKLNIFKDYLKLGENLFNDIECLEISDEITRFIDIENLDSNKLKLEFHDFFPNEFFKDISSIVSNNKKSINHIFNWTKKYGLPNVDTSIYYDIGQFTNNSNDKEVKYIKEALHCYSCDILPLVNSSIMFYLIFNLQNCISQVKLKFLKKYISPFPYLLDEYSINYNEAEERFEYDSDFGNIINNYNKKIIQILNYYLQDSICSRDESEILYPDTVLPDTKDDVGSISSNLFPTEYLVRSPILLVFEYLCRILSIQNFTSTIYYCDNCNEMLASDEELCIGCKLSIGNKFLEFHTKKINKHSDSEIQEIKDTPFEQLTRNQKSILNSIKYITILKNEIKLINEKGVASTPTIIQLYRDNRDQHKHNKKRNNKS